MKICHVCGAECADDAELCLVCGAELCVEDTEEEVQATEIILENPVLAASVEDIVTAEIYRDMLTENGILFTSGDVENSMKLVFGGGFATEDIYVDEGDLEAAQRIYDEVLNAEPQFEEEFFEEFEENGEE